MSSSLKSYKIASRFCEHNQNVWGLSLLKRRTKIFVFNYGFPIRLLLLVLLGFIGVAGHGGGSSQPSHSTTSIPTTRSHEDFYNNAAEHLLTSQEIVEFHSEKLFDKSNFSLPNSTKNKNSTKDDEDDNDLSSSASINISHQSKLSYNKNNNNHANNAKKVMPKSRKKDSSHQHPHHSEPLEMSHRLDEEFKDSNSVPVVPIELPPPNDTIHYHYTDDLDSNLQFYTDFTRIPLPSSSFSPFSSTTAHYSSSTNVPLPNSSESPYYLQDYIKLDEDDENNRNFDKRVKVQQSTKNNNNNYHRNNNNKNNSSVLRASTQSKSKSNNKQQWSQSHENGQSTRRKPYTNIDDIPLDSSSSENSPIHYRPDGPQNYENNYENYNYDSQSTNNKNNRLKRRRPELNSHRNTEQNRIFYDESPFVINSKRKNENKQSYQDHDYNYNDEEEEDNNNDDDHFKQHQHNYYIKSNKENELSSSRNHEISRDKKYQDDLTSHQLLADSKSKNTIKDFEKSEEKLEEFESKKIIGKSIGPKNILKSGSDGGSSSPVSKEGSSKSKSKKSEKTISDPSSSSKNKINSSSSSHNNNFNRNSTMLSDNSLEDVNLSFQDESASSDNDDEDGGSLMRRRPRRSVVHLYDMVVCATGCNPLAYKGYGCYCGFLGSGLTVDGIDRCCAKHDWCYHAAKCPPLLTYFVPYYWVCNDGRPRCVTDYRGWKGMCGANLCECDRQFAECLRKFPCPRSRAMCMTSPWRNLPIGPNLVFLA